MDVIHQHSVVYRQTGHDFNFGTVTLNFELPHIIVYIYLDLCVEMKIILFFQLIATFLVLGLFLKGFFPLKKKWDTKQHSSTFSFNIKNQSNLYPAKVFDVGADGNSSISMQTNDEYPSYVIPQSGRHFRIVLMIIDAFREDFAYGPLRYLPLTHEILKKGKGMKFTAETMPPTVTLPRIKAMVTGSTSSFADVVLNFGSAALEEDNIISRLKAGNRRVVFYGDDTWLKLFPKHFDRSDGTTSFFVSDYTEVDNNVTRHLTAELENPTYDIMILHYLGLDHIGHFAGPRSPLIRPKLAEMDTLINQIYNAMEKWTEPGMLIVCGDHGMSDQGGHGGASPGEITVPVLFLSPQIFNSDPKHYGTISQTDLCPTLAILQGVSIPNGNIGKVLTDVLVGFTLQDKLNLLYHNAKQSMNILKECVPDLQRESALLLLQQTEKKLQRWFMSKNSSSKVSWEDQGDSLIVSFNEILKLISEKISTLATSYDVYAMAIAIVLMWMILVSLVLSSVQEQTEKVRSLAETVQLYGATIVPVLGSAILSHIIMCTGGVPSDTVCSASISGVMLQAVLMAIFVCLALHIITLWPSLAALRKQVKVRILKCSLVEALLLVGTASHTFTLLSSSLVEEEHQTFYFLVTAVHFLFLLQLCARYIRGFSTVRGRQRNLCNVNRLGSQQDKDESLFWACKHCDVWNREIEISGSNNSSQTACDSSSSHCSGEETSEKSHTTAIRTHSSLKQTESVKIKEKDKDVRFMHQSVPTESGVGAPGQPCMTTTSFLHWTFSVVTVLLMLRVLRRWNHTGNKWLDIPDLGDWLVKPENQTYLSLLTVFAFMMIGASRGSRLRRVQTMCVNLSLCCVYLCRAAEGSLLFPYRKLLSSSGVPEARASYVFSVLTCIISLLPQNFLKLENKVEQPSSQPVSTKSKSISSSSTNSKSKYSSSSRSKVKRFEQADVTLKSKEVAFDPDEDDRFSLQQRLKGVMAATVCFACLVKQPHNASVLAAMSLAEQMMNPVLIQIGCRSTYALLYSVWMGQAFFFLQGNSNSLSTVDIAAGYVGLDSYWPAMNGILLCLATYVGPIFWSLAFLNFLMTQEDMRVNQQGQESKLFSVPDSSCRALLLTRVMPLSVYMALVSAQRYHLFVWSVFSPKLLYEAASTVIVGLQLLVFACTGTSNLRF